MYPRVSMTRHGRDLGNQIRLKMYLNSAFLHKKLISFSTISLTVVAILSMADVATDVSDQLSSRPASILNV